VTENSSKILSRISASRWGAFVQFQDQYSFWTQVTLIVEFFFLQSIPDGIKRKKRSRVSQYKLPTIPNVLQIYQ